MKRLFAVACAAFVVSCAGVRASEPDEQYLGVYGLIQEADKAVDAGQSRAAVTKYLEAQAGLKNLQSTYPDWNPKIVNFRMQYIAGKLEPLTQKAAAVAAATPAVSPTQALTNQLVSLQEDNTRLSNQNALLEAKLREALSVQPASSDPRELAKAEERIKQLQKERDALTASIEKSRTQPAPATGKSSEKENQQFEALKEELANQAIVVDLMRRQSEELRKQLSDAAAQPKPTTATPAPSPDEALNKQVLSLKEENTRLAAQVTLLQTELRKTPPVQPAPASANPQDLARAEERIALLQKERDLLAASLEQARAHPPASTSKGSEKEKLKVEELKEDLANQKVVVDLMRTQNEELRKQLAGAGVQPQQSSTPAAPPAQVAELKETITTLQAEAAAAKKERDELLQKLNSTTREPTQQATAKPPSVPSNAELERQLETLRAKVQTFEAKAAPFTPEEQALFKQPVPKETAVLESAKPPIAAAGTPPAAKKSHELPPGTGPLIAAAERAVDAGRYDEAERRFTEILRQDESNVYLRSRLAASQLDQDKQAEAEANLKLALAADPEHAPSLGMMGDLKYRQKKYDEAVEALSLAAKLRPDRPDTHYMLGRALIEKGNRAPAEASLRKAVQLKPGWGEPHYQLAVLYATQKPSFPELAQYHYKKAIAGGIPRNLEFEKFLEKPLTAKVP